MTTPFRDASVSAVKGAYRTKQRAVVARFAQAEFESRYRKLMKAGFVDVVFSYSAGLRRSVFRDLDGFDTSFPNPDNEDTELSYRLARTGSRIVFNPAAIVYHRHPDTLWKYLSKKYSRAYWRAIVYRRYPDKAIKDSYTPQTLKLQILSIYLALAALPFVPISGVALYLSGLGLGAFLLSMLPFLTSLPASDVARIVASPALLLLRALFMGAGLLSVIPRLLVDLWPRKPRPGAG